MARVAPIGQLDNKLDAPGKSQGRQSVRNNSQPPRPSLLFSSTDSQPLSQRGSSVVVARNGVREAYSRAGWFESNAAVAIRKFIRGKAFSILAMVCLFIALFCRDIFVVCQVPSNTELDIILTSVFALFLFEFVGLALTDTTYLLGFFFWMDLLGTASMLFDISFMLGSDATVPHRVRDSGAQDNVIVVRAARAAKLGARAGRLSRVLKILRFLPFLYSRDQGRSRVKMARVITNQLNTVLAQRVAFLTICIVVMMPIFNLFQYPENDYSFTSWAEILASDVTGVTNLTKRHISELQRFADFYKDLNYGPFEVCYGELDGDDFHCQPDILDLHFDPSFSSPVRRASIREVSHGYFQASYDMSTPNVQEAAANMACIFFIIFSMLGFGLLMSNSISVVALTPLERMLGVVRERCKEIFKFAAGLQEDGLEPADVEDETEQDSEFMLLEQVVAKLAAIANLSTENQEPQVTEGMNEEDLIKLNWMQGTTASAQLRTSVKKRNSMFNVSHTLDTHADDATGSRGLSGVPASMNNIPPEVIHSLDTQFFNVLDWQKELKISVATHMLVNSEGCAAWVRSNIVDARLLKFVTIVESHYLQNPFHNFSHGVDVLYSVSRFLKMIDASNFISEVSEYLLLIAAIAHDVGHLGVNNQFLMETSQDLAVKYNDWSPMEMMHCAKLFQIVKDPECDVFSNMDKELYKEVRRGIIGVILHTDMIKHADMIKELGLLYQMNSESFDGWEPSSVVNASQQNVQLVLNALLHCADISNPMKPWELCFKYANLCLDEFFAQGDKEKAMSVPVQFLNDRDKVNRPNSQVGFIEFAITPMAEAIVNLFPQLDSLAENLGKNITKWNEAWQAEVNPPQSDRDKVNARTQKVVARCKALMRDARNDAIGYSAAM